MKIKKVNNIVIKPIKEENQNVLPVKGQELIDNCYANIFCLAKKKSGKTTVIYRLMQKTIGKDTKVFIFCSTVHKDPAYKKMMDDFDDRGIYFEAYTSIYEEGENILENIINEMKVSEKQEEQNPIKVQPLKSLMFGTGEETVEPKKKKPKYLTPEYVFIFDDLGQTLRDKTVEQLLKTNRHYKSRVIISSQYLNDLLPASILQLDYLLMFKGLPIEKLEEVYKKIDMSTPFESFVQMYEIATAEPFHFFYIDIRNEKFRRDFNLELMPNKETKNE